MGGWLCADCKKKFEQKAFCMLADQAVVERASKNVFVVSGTFAAHEKRHFEGAVLLREYPADERANAPASIAPLLARRSVAFLLQCNRNNEAHYWQNNDEPVVRGMRRGLRRLLTELLGSWDSLGGLLGRHEAAERAAGPAASVTSKRQTEKKK